jgi:hypothetical protein
VSIPRHASTGPRQFQLSTGKQTEVGLKLFCNGRCEWTLAGYEIVKNNLLAMDPNNPAVTDQIGQQSSRGVGRQSGLVLDGGCASMRTRRSCALDLMTSRKRSAEKR